MSDLTHTLGELVTVFEDMQLAYVVMGGLAVRVHGIPRPTYDIDFTLAIGRDDLPNLYARLTEAGYTVPELYRQGWVDRIRDMPLVKLRIYLEGHGIDIDLFLVESEFQQEVIARRRRAMIDDREVWIVTPEDLILLKLLASRPRDLGDAGDVLFVQGDLDLAYMRKWAERLGVAEPLQRLLESQTP